MTLNNFISHFLLLIAEEYEIADAIVEYGWLMVDNCYDLAATIGCLLDGVYPKERRRECIGNAKANAV